MNNDNNFNCRAGYATDYAKTFYTRYIILGSRVCKTLFCLPLGAQKCKIDCTIRHFQALLYFYTRIFQTSSNQGV